MKSTLVLSLCLIAMASCKTRKVPTTSNVQSGTNDRGFAAARKECLIDWTQKPFTFAPIKGDYQRDAYNVTVDTMESVTGNVLMLGSWTLSFYDANSYMVDKNIDQLIADLKATAQRLPNNDDKEFRTACIAQCAATHLLKYDNDAPHKYGCISKLAGEGRGSCTEFSRVAEYIGGRLGLRMATVGSSNHKFDMFYSKSKRQWYTFEPNASTCEFMDPSWSQVILKLKTSDGSKAANVIVVEDGSSVAVELFDCSSFPCKLNGRSSTMSLQEIRTGNARNSVGTGKYQFYVNHWLTGSIKLIPESCTIEYTTGVIGSTTEIFTPLKGETCMDVNIQVGKNKNKR